MKLIAFLAGCLIASPLCAYEQEGDTIKLEPSEVVQCLTEGGCFVVTQKQLTEAMYQLGQEAFAAGKAEAQSVCRNRT